ncbi:hypothetical protein [Rhodopila sp.]
MPTTADRFGHRNSAKTQQSMPVPQALTPVLMTKPAVTVLDGKRLVG